MNKLIIGAIAGCVATMPMTLVMTMLHRRLPPEERQPLPPREVTMEIADAVGLEKHLSEPQRRELTIISHFAYGAAAGAAYAPLAGKITPSPALEGVLYGLAVWSGSYLGWLPLTDIQPPVTQKAPRRVALMLAAHVVWGAATGIVLSSLDRTVRR